MNIHPQQLIKSTQTKVAVVYVGSDGSVDFCIAATSADEKVSKTAERVSQLKCGSAFTFCGLSEPVVVSSHDNVNASITVFAVFVVFRFHREYKFSIKELSCPQLWLLLDMAVKHLTDRKFPITEDTINAINAYKKEKRD